MAQQMTKEEDLVFSTWKASLKQKGIKYSDYGLRRMLIWSRQQGFDPNPDVAFSISAWEEVGRKLWDFVSRGDKDAADLATTWRLLRDTLKDHKAAQDKADPPVQVESESGSASTAASTCDASTITEDLSRLSLDSPCRHSWVLPPATVSVTPRNPQRFWAQVKRKVAEMGDWDLVEALEHDDPPAEALPALQHSAADGTGQNHEYSPFAWKFVVDLRARVVKHGLNSPEVTRMLQVVNTDLLLVPYDITRLAEIMFSPEQYLIFESTWRRAAKKAALANREADQNDPRKGVGVDMLMGTHKFNNPQVQVQWPLVVLQQCQQVGMHALARTMKLAAPSQRYTLIRQGKNEPFLQFVEKLAEALDKQVDADGLKRTLCRQLARDNANENCRKIIEALPGEPSIVDMVTACFKVGTVIAAEFRAKAVPKCFGCGKDGHFKAKCPDRKHGAVKSKRPQVKNITCNQCGKAGHFAKECHSKFHIDGQVISGNRRKNTKGRAPTQIPPSHNPGNPFAMSPRQSAYPAQSPLSPHRYV